MSRSAGLDSGLRPALASGDCTGAEGSPGSATPCERPQVGVGGRAAATHLLLEPGDGPPRLLAVVLDCMLSEAAVMTIPSRQSGQPTRGEWGSALGSHCHFHPASPHLATRCPQAPGDGSFISLGKSLGFSPFY